MIVDIPQMAATRRVISNGQGAYSVPPLMPGLYNLTIEANGFKNIYLEGVVMEANQRAAGLCLDDWQQIGQYYRFGERAAAQHLGGLREHADWQPVCGQNALERAEL